MTDTIARNYARQGPYEEVWFAEVMAGPDRGLWIRYTLTHGRSRRGSFASASVWAIAFTRDSVRAYKSTYPLSSLDERALAFRVGDNWIDRAGAEGKAGPVSWKLTFEDGGLEHDPLPPLLKKLPMVTRQWVPAILDLRCSGTLEIGGLPMAFEDQPGVVGHIWGTKNGLRDWAWGHCNSFHNTQAVFEGLSGRLDRPLLRRKTLSTFFLHLEGRSYAFKDAMHWLTSKAEYGGARWTFSASDGSVTLEGEASLPEAATARVEYTNTAGEALFCSNSRFSYLRLRLTDPARGMDRLLESRDAAFELGARERPSEPLDLPAAR